MPENSYEKASQALLGRLISRVDVESPEGLRALCEALSILEQARIYADAKASTEVVLSSDGWTN